jgi:hypothetical protein
MANLSASVHVPSMLHAEDQNDLFDFEDLIDDPIVAAPRRVQTFEFAEQRLSKTMGVLCDRSEDRRERRFSDLLR